MKKWALSIMVAVAMLGVTGGELSAHGMTVVLEQRGEVVVVTARYDGGIPVADADVVVRAPGDVAFQTGKTDAAGTFAFLPASSGEWRVVVDDGMGHRRTARLTFEATDPAAAPGDTEEDDAAASEGGGTDAAAGPAPETLPWRLATGLSLLFGITGFGYGLAARKRNGARAG